MSGIEFIRAVRATAALPDGHRPGTQRGARRCFTSRLQGANIYGAQGRELVDHAIGTAYLARLLADRLGVDSDEAFMCELLHDLGKLLPAEAVARLHQVRRPHAVDAGNREGLHGAASGDRGSTAPPVALPETLEHPVRFHHDPDACTSHKSEATVACVANRLAHRYGFGCPADPASLLEDAVCARVGLDEAWLADLDRRGPPDSSTSRDRLWRSRVRLLHCLSYM